MSEADLAAVWARSLDELAEMHIEPAQRAWLQLTRPLGLVENTALIATPNEFVKEQLETRLRSLITNALSRELGRSIQLAVTVDPAVISSLPSPDRDLDRGRDLGGRDYDRDLDQRGGQSPTRPDPADSRLAGRGGLGPGPSTGHAPGNGLGQHGTSREMPAGPPMEPGTDLSAGGLSSGGIDPVTGRPRPMSVPGQHGQGPAPGITPGGPGPGLSHAGPGSDRGHGPGLGPLGSLAAPRPGQTRLNPKYTFETFVIGSSNRF